MPLFYASKRKSSAKIQMDIYPFIKSDLNIPFRLRYEGKCWMRMQFLLPKFSHIYCIIEHILKRVLLTLLQDTSRRRKGIFIWHQILDNITNKLSKGYDIKQENSIVPFSLMDSFCMRHRRYGGNIILQYNYENYFNILKNVPLNLNNGSVSVLWPLLSFE